MKRGRKTPRHSTTLHRKERISLVYTALCISQREWLTERRSDTNGEVVCEPIQQNGERQEREKRGIRERRRVPEGTENEFWLFRQCCAEIINRVVTRPGICNKITNFGAPPQHFHHSYVFNRPTATVWKRNSRVWCCEIAIPALSENCLDFQPACLYKLLKL